MYLSGIEKILFIAVILAQVLLGVYAALRMRGIHARHNFALSSKTNIAETLQKFNLIYDQINIRVAGEQHYPARAEAGLLVVNKRYAYTPTLFPTFYAVYQILLTYPHRRYLRAYKFWATLLFVIEIIAGILSFFTYWWFGLIALAIGTCLFIFSLLVYVNLSGLLEDAGEIAIDLLDLDKVEQTQLAILQDDLRGVAFTYAWEPFSKIFGFFVPKL